MLSQNEIWEGIVHKWATGAQIIDFIEGFLDSDYYDELSNHDQLGHDIFYRTMLDELCEHRPSKVIYQYVEYRLGDYGWQLED